MITITRIGPGASVQDLGRPGFTMLGLSVGGAADMMAQHEGAALLGQGAHLASLEMAGMGGSFRAKADLRIALTGAPMRAQIDGETIRWNSTYALPQGAELHLGGARGNYGYLHLGGGIATPEILGARSTHFIAGLGAALDLCDLPLGPDTGGAGHGVGHTLDVADRFSGGVIRIIPSVQTSHFDAATLDRLEQTQFSRNPRSNRMGVRLAYEGAPFRAADTLSILSEVVVPGDIQIAGDGTPFVLLCEHQTTGGYPRIGTVIPPDLARVAQASVGAPLQFQFIDRAAALAAYRVWRQDLSTLTPRPLVRDPHDIADLLSYQLIDGAITGEDP